MDAETYERFTRRLLDRLAADERVLGLVALGSMAARDYVPDAWSDHDFFVITRPGAQESLRTDLFWLPDAERIAFHFRETAHGLKAIYADGHLVEFAVFDLAELNLAKINRYRTLLDRGGVEEALARVREATKAWTAGSFEPDDHLLGQLLSNLLVGVGRHARGERLSGGQFVKSHALRHLLVLLERHLPAEGAEVLDDLDPLRRFERIYPELGREIDALQLAAVPTAARGLLEIARRELAGRLPGFPTAGVEAVAAGIRKAEAT